MANLRQVAQYGLNALLKAGAGKAQCVVTFTDKHEMNVELGEFSLLRTTFDTNIRLTAIKDNRRGSTSINKSDNESIDKAASDVLAIAAASAPTRRLTLPKPSRLLNSHPEAIRLTWILCTPV